MLKKLLKRTSTLCVAAATFLVSTLTWAALPTPVSPTTIGTATGSGDWLNLIAGYLGDAGKVAGMAIAVGGFLYVAWTGFQKFNEARQGRAEWGEVIVLSVVGAALLLLSAFFLGEASTVIEKIA